MTAKPTRRYIITHTATDYDVEDATEACIVTLRENAVDTANLILADEYADYYTNKITSEDRLRIYFGYTTDPPTTLVFDGYVDDVTPTLTNNGVKTGVTARSVGRSLLMSVVGEEYGGESVHDDLDTLKEIITDANDGIVPNWVNKIPWSGDTTSGYSLGLDAGGTDYVANIAGTVKYLYFAYQPAKKALDDLMDVLQAIKGAAAGPHYVVTPTNYLCVATVASHEAGPTNLWSTWWRTNQAGSTLTQGVDFITHNFRKQPKEANYILYHGKYRKPVNEAWTEEGDTSANGASLWAKDPGADALTTITDDNVTYKVGSTSIKFHLNDEAGVVYAQVPSAAQNWEIDKWGGKYNKPVLHFALREVADINSCSIYLMDGAGNDFHYSLHPSMTFGTWQDFTLPVGPYWDQVDTAFGGWVDGGASWSDIDYIRILGTCIVLSTGDIWVDDLHFDGWILRGARPAAAYTATNPAKVKVITDDVAKDDSGVGTDDTGMMGRLAYAELLRAKTTPVQGQIMITGKEDLMGGQLVHIHAAKAKAGTYGVDDDFRVQEHRLVFDKNGFRSMLSLSDDVVNARPRPPHSMMSLILKTTNPDFQNRQITGIKAKEIDITQTVMENTY